MDDRSARKVRTGVVISDARDKTVTVQVTDSIRHARYEKTVIRRKKLHAHDENNEARIGDKVQVMETRPLSKSKRWRVTEIVEKAR
ncbi:MAG: 30S ribosomal protein S17 [Acidimicrobiia bacterium]|nr:30S ribosomal protein S17 [Acidimicrobiia bacterium]